MAADVCRQAECVMMLPVCGVSKTIRHAASGGRGRNMGEFMFWWRRRCDAIPIDIPDIMVNILLACFVSAKELSYQINIMTSTYFFTCSETNQFEWCGCGAVTHYVFYQCMIFRCSASGGGWRLYYIYCTRSEREQVKIVCALLRANFNLIYSFGDAFKHVYHIICTHSSVAN